MVISTESGRQPDATLIAVWETIQGGVNLHEVATGDLRFHLETGRTIGHVAISRDGLLAIVCRPSVSVKLYDYASGDQRFKLELGHNVKINNVAS